MTPAELRAKATAALPENGGGGGVVLTVNRAREPRGGRARPLPGGPFARIVGTMPSGDRGRPVRVICDMPAAPLLAWLDKIGA